MRAGAKRLWGPALALFLLSPIVGELLSGSSPPIEFFSFGWLFIVGLYGSGALIVRELSVRWNKGWMSILVMGAAYGIIEEGLEVKSFFDPSWVDLGALGEYGRWAGVNWVWSLELTIYHCVFSIAIPILLVTLLYPSRSGSRWVSDRTVGLLFLLLSFNVVFGFLFLTRYRPEPFSYVLTLGLVACLFLLAYLLPKRSHTAVGRPPSRPRRFFLLGLGFAIGLFFISWVLPSTGVPALLAMDLLVLLCLASLLLLLRMSGYGSTWDERHQLALASGALAFLIALAPLQEFNGPSMRGMSLVALAFCAFLLFLWKRVNGARSPCPPPGFRPQRSI